MSHLYKSDTGKLALMMWDLVEGLKRWRIWTNLAWGEIHARYGRTLIGVSWNVISFGLFCLAIIAIFGGLSGDGGGRFGPHVVVGYLVFTFISGLMTDSCGVLVLNETWLKSTRLPYGIFIYKGIMKNLILLGFNLIAAIAIILIFFDLSFNKYQLLIFPAFFIILLNGIAVYMLFGILCARYRDLTHLIITVIRFAFFITPIMWEAGDFGLRGKIAVYNPLTHFIEIIREPALYGDPAYLSWIIVLSITAFIWIISIFAFANYRKKIIYWI